MTKVTNADGFIQDSFKATVNELLSVFGKPTRVISSPKNLFLGKQVYEDVWEVELHGEAWGLILQGARLTPDRPKAGSPGYSPLTQLVFTLSKDNSFNMIMEIATARYTHNVGWLQKLNPLPPFSIRFKHFGWPYDHDRKLALTKHKLKLQKMGFDLVDFSNIRIKKNTATNTTLETAHKLNILKKRLLKNIRMDLLKQR